MTEALSPSRPNLFSNEIDSDIDNLASIPLESSCEVEKTTWAGGKIIHSIKSGASKTHIVLEAHGRLGRPIFELKDKSAVVAKAYAPGYTKHLTDPWCLNIYDGKGALLARLLPKSGSFGLARSLDIATPEGVILAHSNLFSKKGADNIKFMCPNQTEEIFSLSIDRSQKAAKWALHVARPSHIDPRVVRIVAAVVSHNSTLEYDASKAPGLTTYRVLKPIGKYAIAGLITTIILLNLMAG